MGMYFDAVLDPDMRPLFNGTPEETREWLENESETSSLVICVGKTMKILTPTEYLSTF